MLQRRKLSSFWDRIKKAQFPHHVLHLYYEAGSFMICFPRQPYLSNQLPSKPEKHLSCSLHWHRRPGLDHSVYDLCGGATRRPLPSFCQGRTEGPNEPEHIAMQSADIYAKRRSCEIYIDILDFVQQPPLHLHNQQSNYKNCICHLFRKAVLEPHPLCCLPWA